MNATPRITLSDFHALQSQLLATKARLLESEAANAKLKAVEEELRAELQLLSDEKVAAQRDRDYFAARLEQERALRVEAAGEPAERDDAVHVQSIAELRRQCRVRGVEYSISDTSAQLVEKLAAASPAARRTPPSQTPGPCFLS